MEPMSAVEFREMLLHLTPNVLTEITPNLKPYPRSKRKGLTCAHPRT
ncbi:MAG TPA: Lsm interaction motif [Caudoviricetes sp.]|nr:MAG TPA: Lsm interaction motif [Caudoviricetes sp.]